MRKPRKRNGVVLVRKTRPPKGVITHAISALNFCRTDQANLLPLANGILYFGSSAPIELMNYNSRIGNMPSYSTVCRALLGLSEQEALETAAHGKDPLTADFLLICRQLPKSAQAAGLRIGHVNLFDLGDKRERVERHLRKDLTAFTRSMTELKPRHAEVLERLRATATLLAPAGQDVVHPLAAIGKKQTIPTELMAAMLDFLEQVGQTPDNYLKRKLPVGGDGLTYAMLQQLQLQVWHTKWTDIIRIFQKHWGRTSGKSTNPSSLGFSASKIGRAAPSNMKKVEFYPGSQLLYLVLDAKLLDIWSLAFETEDIFTYFKDLFMMARKLYRAYGTARGRDHAMFDTGTSTEWAKTVLSGSVWVPAEIEDSSLDKKKRKSKKPTAKEKKEKHPPKLCKGDHVLAQDIDFIRDALNSRKLATAVATEDLGRLYECLKVCLTIVLDPDLMLLPQYLAFTVGGSTHTNYINYVVETILNLELESSRGLKYALLRGLIWNLTGLPGYFEEGDFIVEFFNRLLEDIVEHKSLQGDRITSAASCRQIDDRDTEDFARGVKKLREGGLAEFKKKTVYNRQVIRTNEPAPIVPTEPPPEERDPDGDESGKETGSDSSSEESDSDDESEDTGPVFFATRGSTSFVDGELVFDDRDMMDGPEPDGENEEEAPQSDGGLYDPDGSGDSDGVDN
ncbi:hypothetical protein B0H13DRAFT_2309719 [Mycena leptocephala]|nr:hypothetical protein B0H13DRAFT_2309719 [Mycena leptocephala]